MATENIATGHGAPEVEAGMPQLDFSTFPNQIFWLVVTLVAIYLVLTKIALPRIAAVLAERNGTITNDIAAAEELKLRAGEAEAAYKKALADARAEAQKIAAETRAEIQIGVDAAIQKADAEISARTAEGEQRIAEIRENAVASVSEVAQEAAAAIVASFGGNASSTDVASAVQSRLKGGA
ncbi:MAG: F-type H+-transporting ATPase subunit b [Paracoccaceae bacterium]|jgi:F-type H+-transporting ATPase subunit b